MRTSTEGWRPRAWGVRCFDQPPCLGSSIFLGSRTRTGDFWGHPESRAFAELLIDCEEDRALRAVLIGMLREADR